MPKPIKIKPEDLTVPQDNIPMDEDSIREYNEKVEKKIENPIEEDKLDPHGKEAGEIEDNLNPNQPITRNPIPKSQFSMWILDAQTISQNQKLYQDSLANAYMNPIHGLMLPAIAFNTWNLIKHGFKTQEKNYKTVENLVTLTQKAAQTLGQNVKEDGRYTGDWSDYMKFLTQINTLWEYILAVKAGLGLSIRFKKEDKSLKILGEYTRNPTKAIMEEGE